MKKRPRILLCFCIALAGVVAVVVLAPVARKINTTLPVTEYRFDDSDYAVEHTITIQGHDTRNLLGHGRFEGYFTVDGQPIHPDGGHFRVQFPPPDIYWNVSDIHPSGYIRTDSRFFSILSDRKWSRCVVLLADVQTDGPRTSSLFDPENSPFWVSGPPDRDAALKLAAQLTQGTHWESLFE